MEEKTYFLNSDFQGKKIIGYSFLGEYVEVASWKEAMMNICVFLANENPELFESFTTDDRLKGKTRYYFMKEQTVSAGGCIENTLVPGTDIYVHTKASSNQIAIRIRNMLTIFGYSPEFFVVYLA